MPDKKPRPLVLMIFDGFGISLVEEDNAIATAGMPNFNQYLREYPAATLQAAGAEVGLPWGEPGNSQTGHANMGSGRVVYQSLPRINQAIKDGSFFTNQVLLDALGHLKKNSDRRLHVVGCVSDGGVHSHIDHLKALIKLADKHQLGTRTAVHAFLDGRDTEPRSAERYLSQIPEDLIASLIGRNFAMDHGGNWAKTKVAYDLLVEGRGTPYSSWSQAIQDMYTQGLDDQDIPPAIITSNKFRGIEDGDIVIFFNFRPDGARQLASAFTQKDFSHFPVKKWAKTHFVSLGEYDVSLPLLIAFPPEYTDYPVGRVVSEAGLKQLRIAETEKYAHVTYYFNSGREKPFPDEDRILIPSPNVENYAQQPEMSAKGLTDRVIKEVQKNKYDFIVLNYANADMVGHTGDFKQTVKALQFLDQQFARAVKAVVEAGGAVLLTCDHGNAEQKKTAVTQDRMTSHTSNNVPVIYINPALRLSPSKDEGAVFEILSQPIGVLADIGPTVLDILGLKKPSAMRETQSLLSSLR